MCSTVSPPSPKFRIELDRNVSNWLTFQSEIWQVTKQNAWLSGQHLSTHATVGWLGGRMRRLGDVLIACALLCFTLPLLLLTAVAIKCGSPGPIFERQERVGAAGRRFKLLTFRTAVHDPERVGPIWAREVTRIGHFLRYTRIDALPQLINVLRGDISLIETGAEPSPFFD
jgi:lipopolysaccharide/colanic/teichoic acid biosynthesis glycosyltransferase